jgi:hypothetical protein
METLANVANSFEFRAKFKKIYIVLYRFRINSDDITDQRPFSHEQNND